MKPALMRTLVFFGLGLLLGGCASFEAQVDRSRSLTGLRRFFVESNLNDNHALDQHIAAALKARGLEAGVGPRTMMPDETQAVVTFQDQWTWDFGDHLVFLKIAVRDPRAGQPFATATFSARVPLREPLPVTVSRLVDRLLQPKT